MHLWLWKNEMIYSSEAKQSLDFLLLLYPSWTLLNQFTCESLFQFYSSGSKPTLSTGLYLLTFYLPFLQSFTSRVLLISYPLKESINWKLFLFFPLVWILKCIIQFCSLNTCTWIKNAIWYFPVQCDCQKRSRNPTTQCGPGSWLGLSVVSFFPDGKEATVSVED